MTYFDVSTCPNCQPGRLCRQHNGVMKDGDIVRVPVMMRDSMQRELADRMPGAASGTRIDDSSYYAQVLDAKERANQAQLTELADNAARVQAHADHFAEQDARNAAITQANPRDAAYATSCADLHWLKRG